MSTIITGEVIIHKADGVTRGADAILVTSSNSLMVWDDIAESFVQAKFPDGGTEPILVDNRDNNIIQPDIIVKPDKWERIERDGHHWKRSTTKSIFSRAEERDDVDADEVKDFMS